MIATPLTPAEDEGARRLAAEILQRTEFSGSRNALEAWERIREWLHWFDWLLGWGSLSTTNPLLFYAILAVLVAIAAALILHIVWSIRAAMMQAVPTASRASTPAETRFDEEAAALATQGRFLEAAHRLQLGVLDLLLRGRRLELSRSEPNRVLRRRLSEARLGEGERRDLLRLLDRFETRWFRDREEDPGLYEDWRGLYLRLARGNASA